MPPYANSFPRRVASDAPSSDVRPGDHLAVPDGRDEHGDEPGPEEENCEAERGQDGITALIDDMRVGVCVHDAAAGRGADVQQRAEQAGTALQQSHDDESGYSHDVSKASYTQRAIHTVRAKRHTHSASKAPYTQCEQSVTHTTCYQQRATNDVIMPHLCSWSLVSVLYHLAMLMQKMGKVTVKRHE